MNKHDKAVMIERLIGAFYEIKRLPRYTGDIDRLCTEGVDKLMKLAEIDGVQKELDEIRKRRLDPAI